MTILVLLAAAWLFIFLPEIAQGQTNDGLGPNHEIARQRGPEIFNAVHNAMRQWGSSVHHNGMSFFLATVPENVLFHHGSSQRESPTEPEWLAYEIEHAEVFARRGRRPGSPPPGERLPYKAGQDTLQSAPTWPKDGQRPINNGMVDPTPDKKGGWLHVYRTTRPLRLLYIDGMSAGKTNMGTLDTQDYLLRGLNHDENQVSETKHNPDPRGGGPMDERDRAKDLCKLCQEWDLEGVIRMEAGFEIIKCDFSEGLEQVQVLQRPPPSNGPGLGMGGLGTMEFVRGLSERYQGIGSSRTGIDFSSMVSAFFFPINLTNPDASRPDLPRLSNTTDSELASVKSYLQNTIKNRKDQTARVINWQDVSDLIVSRYADRLEFLAQKMDSVDVMSEEINFLLDVFIDYSDERPDLSGASSRCTQFYLGAISPVTESDYLLQVAFNSVTERICTTLFKVRELLVIKGSHDHSPVGKSVKELKELIKFLGWSRFKRCPSCEVNEVCMIPMWPLGTTEDYYHPHCKVASEVNHGQSYWEDFRSHAGHEDERRRISGLGKP